MSIRFKWVGLGLAAVLASGLALAQPVNDACADAISVDGDSTVTGTTIGATWDDAPTCGTTNTAPGVWYKVVGDGGPMEINTCNSATTYDSKLTVYADGCGTLTCVGGNDDACGLQSRVQWNSNAGQEYLILVHGFASAAGPYEMEIIGGQGSPPTPVPDPANSSVVASNQTPLVDEVVDITVTVIDSDSDPMSGVTVFLNASDQMLPTGLPPIDTEVTDANGVAVFQVVRNAPIEVTFSASAEDVLLGETTVEWRGAPAPSPIAVSVLTPSLLILLAVFVGLLGVLRYARA